MSNSADASVPFSEGEVFPPSIVQKDSATYFMARLASNGNLLLGLRGSAEGFNVANRDSNGNFLSPLTPANAAALRKRLPWLNPVPLGLKASFGFGDRIGLATPGHIAALRSADPQGQLAPILAQQSVRENTRTGRTPQQVLDDATWAVFLSGWRKPWGADADHVKEVSDLGDFVQAGYTFYTIDPSDHVDNRADAATIPELQAAVANLPWALLETKLSDTQAFYSRQSFRADGFTLAFNNEILLRALAKYGAAIAHTRTLALALGAASVGQSFDLEMSVDETDTPTSLQEHFFIANELTRLSVPVNSLALRFVGKFQKGVDYIGNLAAFEKEFVRHAAIMSHFGSYKLSIHTGSDKFSLYQIIARHAAGRVHVKTAGTSYLEALRVLARHEPALFREILDLARGRFEVDRKTYFLDANLARVPAASTLADADLPSLLDQFDARQVLHVAFGSVLSSFGDRLHPWLEQHLEQYWAALESHFIRHVSPFVR
ncbi:MAG: tagaturonate epimerase family protein [Anaerolineales bacterium]